MIAPAATMATSATARASGAVPRKFLLLPSLRLQRGPARKLAERCDRLHTGRPRAARRRAGSTPSTRSTLSRAVWPRATVTRDGATPAFLATRRHSASFALPSTGGALTRMRIEPARSPTISSRRARGWSRTLSSVRRFPADGSALRGPVAPRTAAPPRCPAAAARRRSRRRTARTARRARARTSRRTASSASHRIRGISPRPRSALTITPRGAERNAVRWPTDQVSRRCMPGVGLEPTRPLRGNRF